MMLTINRFVADMKLAHYLHIAPRTLFMAQGLATLVGAIVQCGVTVFMITRIDGVCTSDAPGGFTCPHGRVTYSSSLIWGMSFPSVALCSVHLKLTLNRSSRTPENLLRWPNLQQSTMVLPRRPRRRAGHVYFGPKMEAIQLYLLACCLWGYESRSPGDRDKFLIVVGCERCF